MSSSDIVSVNDLKWRAVESSKIELAVRQFLESRRVAVTSLKKRSTWLVEGEALRILKTFIQII